MEARCARDIRATVEHRASKPGELTWLSTSTFTAKGLRLKTTHVEIADRSDLPARIQSPDTFVIFGDGRGSVSKRIDVADAAGCSWKRTYRVPANISLNGTADLEDKPGNPETVQLGIALGALGPSQTSVSSSCQRANSQAMVSSYRTTAPGVRTTLGADLWSTSWNVQSGNARPLGRLLFPLNPLVAGRPFELHVRASQPAFSRSVDVHVWFTPRAS
jgi:hypothetical protein